jgi:anti-sigma28 factor (negative regulator of flagellin synthesis)
MTEDEIKKFHEEHPDETATCFEEGKDKKTKKALAEKTKRQSNAISNVSTKLPDSLSNFGNGMKTSTIMRAPVEELKAAVKEGILSRARFRIEMKRRQNKGYYNSLSDVEEIHI